LSTRLLLEGPDIETLLSEVYSNYGEQARIIKAERVRTGGMAGFFAKERYEVSIEVDDLAQSLNNNRSSVTGVGSTGFSAGSSSGDDVPVALLVAEAMNHSGNNVDRASTRGPKVSTSSPAFAGVLDSLANAIGSDVVVPAPDLKLTSTPCVVEADELPKVNWPDASVANLQSMMASPDAFGPEVSMSEFAMPRILHPEIPMPEIQTQAAPEPAPIRSVAIRRPTDDQDLSKPPRPPRGPGQVLALVGDPAVAFKAGLALAERMRIPTTRVLLASAEPVVPGMIASRRLPDVVAARKRSVRLVSLPDPSVVAIDLPIGAIWDDEAVDWAREMAAAVGAVAIWAVVDATRKIEDLANWLTQLGPVDALVVHNAAVTDDLLSLRDLGYPIAILDDRLATRAAWRSVLGPAGFASEDFDV